MFSKVTVKFLILAIAWVLADLIIKYFIRSNFEPTEMTPFMNGFFSIGRIHTVRIAFGDDYNLIGYAGILFRLIVLIFFIRIWKAPVSSLFKIACVFIVAGWIGNYIDRFAFSEGNTGYVQMDYFYINGVFDFFFSLTGIIILIGWILLLIAMIIRVNDLKILFSRKQTK